MRFVYIFLVCMLELAMRANAAANICPNCKEILLDAEMICPYCPADLSIKRETDSHSKEPDSVALSAVINRLGGMGRGIVTTALSPLNIIRGMATGLSWLSSTDNASKKDSFDAGQLGPLGAALAGGAISVCIVGGVVVGTITTCTDAVDGVIDFGSAGFYGDWLYDSKASGNPTPWIWERKWVEKKMPWIDRK